MEEKRSAGNFKLTVPLDASAVEHFKPEKAVKVVVRDGKGGLQSQTAKLDEKGHGNAAFTFSGNPGAVRVVAGPEDASDQDMMRLQTIGVDVAASHWHGEELTLSPVAISTFYWRWWQRWCRTFTIHGRVVCPNGNPVPGATVCGICPFTWYRPTNPGASPAKLGVTAILPMVMVGSATSACPVPTAPLAGGVTTAPSPLQ